jgi:hypothetical protein
MRLYILRYTILFTANSGSAQRKAHHRRSSRISLAPMIKKRTRPQTRVRNFSPDPSDSAPATDSQQEQSEQHQDEGDLPYALVSSCPPFSPNVHTSATVSLNSSSSANFVVHGKELMRPS